MQNLNLCRLCAETTNELEALSLFDRNRRQLLRELQELTGLALRNVKNLPYLICNTCQLDAQQALSFRMRCLSAQRFFKSSKFKNSVEQPTVLPDRKSPQESLETMQVKATKPEAAKSTELTNFEPDAVTKTDVTTAIQTTTTIKSNSKNQISLQSKVMRSFKKRKKMLQTSDVKDLICDRCGNHFNSRHHFEVHLRRHLGDKQHQCELCSDKFFTNSELKRHIRKHTGEKPFACSYCNRCFTDYSTRVKHERTHTNERPFKCTHCSKAFTTSYILKNHLLTHTGERSFKCTLCNKSFQRQTNLATHYRSMMHKQNEQMQNVNKLTTQETPAVLNCNMQNNAKTIILS